MAGNSIEKIEIDFVLLWVDGNDPDHIKARDYWQKRVSKKELAIRNQDDFEECISDLRFIQHDELKYCLRSIKQYAPWYRKIHLVTDNQVPAFLDKQRMHLDRIEVIDHKDLFLGHEECLPTFNTRCLTTMISRIQGLSEYFIYGNDDMMLANFVQKDFFYENGKAIVYATWGSLENGTALTLHQQGVVNAAEIMGFDQSRFLILSHGFQPMIKSSMIDLAKYYPKAFLNNIQYKFRHESQFLPESLFNHYAINSGKGSLKSTELMVHFSVELCRSGSADKITFLFDLLRKRKRNMFCLNEFQAILPRVPEVKKWLEEICGNPLQSEIANNKIFEC